MRGRTAAAMEDGLLAGSADIRDMFDRANQRLGFGCGEIYDEPDRKGTLRLLEAAIDNGITYFDTARLYGHGKAEYLLGELMPRYREKIVLTSKAGILPTYNPLSKKIRDKALLTAGKFPLLKSYIPPPVPAKPTFGVFGIADLRLSIETSLRALRTDRLDFLLLHECTYENATNPEIVSLLHSLVTAGKIRAWGTATDIKTTVALANDGRSRVGLLQFSSSAWDNSVNKVRALTDAPLITHSLLGAKFRGLVSALREDPSLRVKAKALDIDPDDASNLAQRLVAAALHANPDGIVLFSTSKVDRIRSNMCASQVNPESAKAALELVAYAQQPRG